MARIKDQVEQVIGRRINGVVIKKAKGAGGSPTNHLFLLFDDESYYEFYTYGCSIGTTSGVVRGDCEAVLSYMSDALEPVYVKHQESGKGVLPGCLNVALVNEDLEEFR